MPLTVTFTPSADTTPNAFDFGGPFEGDPDEIVYSDEITIAGTTPGAPLDFSVSGGHGGCCGMQIQTGGAGDWSAHASSGTAYLGDKARLRTRALETYSASFTLTGIIGGVSDTITVDTVDEEYGAPDAPSIAPASAAGVNPLLISIDWGDDNLVPPIDDGSDYGEAVDTVHHRHRENGGSWVTSDPIPVDMAFIGDHLVDGIPIEWSDYDPSDYWGGGMTIGRMVGISRQGGTVEWSNEVSDTLDPYIAPPGFTLVAAPAGQANTATTHTFTNIPFLDGIPVVLVSGESINGVSITPSGGGTTTTLTDRVTAGSANRAAIYSHTTTVAAGNYDVVVSHSGSVARCAIFAGTLVSVVATPTDTALRTEASAGSGGFIEASSSLTVNTDGVGLAICSGSGSPTLTWSAGTALGQDSTSGRLCSVVEYAAGTVTPKVVLSVSGYSFAVIAAAAWDAI